MKEAGDSDSTGPTESSVTFENLARRVAQLSSIYLFGNVLVRIFSLLLLPIFTFYLIPEQLGIVHVSQQWIAFLIIAMQFGLSSALNSHYFREEEENRSQLIMNVVIGDIILAFVCCLIASYLGALYSHLLLPNLPLNDENRYALWHIIIWTSFLTILVFLGRNVLTLREEAVKSVSLNMARYFLQIGLGLFVVVVIGWKGFGRQAMGLVGAAVTAIVSIRILARRSEGLFRWQQFCIVARTALTFYPSALINAFAITVNVWLLAHLTSAVEIGIYGVALMFGQFLGWPVTALHSGSFPTAAKMMRQGNAESRSRQSRIYSLMIVMTTLSALILATISPLAIELLTTSAYHEAKHYTSPIVLAFLFRACPTRVSGCGTATLR